MHTLTTAPIAASTPGALDGFEVRCTCGFRATTSLTEREALRAGVAHVEWTNGRRDAGKQTREVRGLIATFYPRWHHRAFAVTTRADEAATLLRTTITPDGPADFTVRQADYLATALERHGFRITRQDIGGVVAERAL